MSMATGAEKQELHVGDRRGAGLVAWVLSSATWVQAGLRRGDSRGLKGALTGVLSGLKGHGSKVSLEPKTPISSGG